MSLNDAERNSIVRMFGPGCSVKCSTAVRLYVTPPNGVVWKFTNIIGVLAVMNDNNVKGHFLRIVDLKNMKIMFEQEIYEFFEYKNPRAWFHTFESDNVVHGLSFANEPEAKSLFDLVNTIVFSINGPGPNPNLSRANSGPPQLTTQASLSNLNTVAATPGKDSKESKKKKKLFGKKKKEEEQGHIYEISGPTSFKHESHIGWDAQKGFEIRNIPPEWKKLFQQAGIRRRKEEERNRRRKKKRRKKKGNRRKMSIVKVNVKWNKQQLEGIELDQSQPVSVFKTQLFSLTGVDPDRQKIMGKTGSVKDDTDWSTLKLKDGYQFMMMGTAGEVVVDAKPTIKFIEDMTEAEIAKEVDFIPGLENLGNTCFANATIQCLGVVPELKSALQKHPGHPGQEPYQSVTAAMRDLFQQMGSSTSAVSPLAFILLMRRAFPQFDQVQNGMYMQQDAEECWTQIMNAFHQKLKVSENESFVKKFFEIEFNSTWVCEEDPEEPPKVTVDHSTKMQCHITTDVGYLLQGLKEGLVERIEKRSERLGRAAMYTKSSKISHLPQYLTTNFVRFFWRRDTQKKAKILKKVKFPLDLDVYEFCTDELKAQLQPAREILLAKDEVDLTGKGKEKEEAADMQVDNPAPLGLSGIYELIAVLTHIGRSSDSGHYMAWVKKSGDDWIRYDDDKATLVKEEEILKLDGGGDWHTAYICLYRSKASKTPKIVKPKRKLQD